MEKRNWGIWLGSIVIGIFVLLFALPTYFSTSVGTRQLARIIGKSTHSKVRIERVSLSWFGGQEASGFNLESKQTSLTFKQFQSDSSLLALLLTKRANNTKLIDPDLTLRVQRGKKRKAKPAFFLPFKGGVDIQNGRLAVQRGSVTTAELHDINVLLKLESALPITIVASGQASGGGEFKLDGSIESAKKTSAAALWLNKFVGLPARPVTYTFNAQADQFPLGGFDGLSDVAISEMIGPTLDLRAQGIVSSDTNVQINIKSAQINGDLNLVAPQKAWTITNGSVLRVDLTPKAFDDLHSVIPGLEDIRLRKTANIVMRFDNLSCPIGKELLYRKINGALAADLESSLTHETLDEPIALSSTLKLQTSELQKHLNIGATGSLTYKSTGSFDCAFGWLKPFDPLNAYDLLTNLKLNVTNLPVSLFGDQAVRYVGEQISASIAAEQGILDLQATSRLINTRTFTFKITPNALQLLKPATLNYTLIDPYFKGPLNLALSFDEIYLPRVWQNMRLKGHFATKTLSVQPIAGFSKIDLSDVGIRFSAKQKKMLLALSSRAQIDSTYQLDPNLEITGDATLNLETLNLPLIAVQATGKNTNLRAKGKYSDGQIALITPIELDTLLYPSDQYPVKLAKPAPAHISVAPFEYDLKEEKFADPLKVSLQAKELQLQTANVFDFTGSVKLAAVKTYDLAGKIDNGNFDIHAELGDELRALEANVTDFPSRLLDDYFEDDVYSNTLGKTVSGSIDYTKTRINLDIDSVKLDVAGSLTIQDDILKNAGDLKVRYLLTDLDSPLKLQNPSSIHLDINSIAVPFKNNKIDWDLSSIAFDGSAKVAEMTIINPTSKATASLQNFFTEIDLSPGDPLKFNAKGNASARKSAQGKEKTGSVAINGIIDHFYNEKGRFSLNQLTARYAATLDKIPTIIIGAFIPHASQIFGDTISANITSDIIKQNGTLDAQISSPHCKAKLSAYIRSGVLTLREPLIADITLTPALNDLLFSDAKLVVISAKQPMRIYIDNKNTSVPIRNFNWQNVRIDAGQIDLGQIIVASKGSAADLIDIFKMRASNQVPMWFAPLDFRVRSGVMQIGRTEILYDMAYQIAIWGRISFPKRYVDMTLGLTAQSLAKAFGLRMPPDYVLTVDIEGPFGNVHIDKGDAIAKIALIIADKSGVVPDKGIAGGIFGVIQGFAHDQSDVPPPKRPFPWER